MRWKELDAFLHGIFFFFIQPAVVLASINIHMKMGSSVEKIVDFKLMHNHPRDFTTFKTDLVALINGSVVGGGQGLIQGVATVAMAPKGNMGVPNYLLDTPPPIGWNLFPQRKKLSYFHCYLPVTI